MVRVISKDLGGTPTLKRREMTALVGAGWDDARDCTVWLNVSHAQKRRVGGRVTKDVLSRYAVSEIEEVGFAGRTFVFDKEFPLDEHGEHEDDGLPKPPYRVRLDQHGSMWCACMGSIGGQAFACRHCDMALSLIEEEVFGDDDEAEPVF